MTLKQSFQYGNFQYTKDIGTLKLRWKNVKINRVFHL